MAVPLPDPDQTLLDAPTAAEVHGIHRGLLSACAPVSGNTRFQRLVIDALTLAMTGVDVADIETEPMSPLEFARHLERRDESFRTRMVQIMELGHMILPEPSVGVADSIIEFAETLSISNDCIYAARAVADGSHQLVAADFDRSAYISSIDPDAIGKLGSGAGDAVQAWTERAVDTTLADRWRALADCPDDSLGLLVHRFYTARGFRFPGQPGSVPPLLAQHDWVHVLAGYGSMVESELEIFAFIARASDDPHAFTLLAMALNLFQSGALPSAAGAFEAAAGHLEREGMPIRLADAMRRGAMCEGSVDFLAVDFFARASRPIEQVRDEFGIVAKSESAVTAGSPTPWVRGGMTDTQLGWGQELAAEQRRPYDSFGAAPC